MKWTPPMRGRLSSRRVAARTAAVVAVAAVAAIPIRDAIRDSQGRRREYLLPAGYTGWCTVEYGVPGAPPLSYRGGATIVSIPANGYLATSSPADLRPGDGHYYSYVSPGGGQTSTAAWGKRGRSLEHGDGRTGVTGRFCESFFVGTRRQYQATARADRGPMTARDIRPTE